MVETGVACVIESETGTAHIHLSHLTVTSAVWLGITKFSGHVLNLGGREKLLTCH